MAVLCAGYCPCPVIRPCDRCPTSRDPVCAEGKLEFDNACQAECNRLGVECRGTCPCRRCRCPDNGKPVCGANDRTYPSRCEANCRNVSVKCERKCPCKQPRTTEALLSWL